MTATRPLVIGVGNPQRGDDAAGPLVAERFAARHGGQADIEIITGDCVLLVDRLAERDVLIIVDACQSGATPGTVHRFDATDAPLPAFAGGVSTHGFGVSEALALAASLDRSPRHCIVFAVEAADFGFDSQLTPAVEAALGSVVEAAADELIRVAEGPGPQVG